MNTFQKDLHQTGLFYNSNYNDNSTTDRFRHVEETERRYQNLLEENVRLKQDLNTTRNRSFSAACPNCKVNLDYAPRDNSPQRANDVIVWSMVRRNQFLEEKVDKLKDMYERQWRTLSSIRNSQKWKSRFECKNGDTDCYEKKYFKLLRVRSPLY